MSDNFVAEQRQKGLDSFFYFTRGILGMDKLTNRFHREMCDKLQYDNALRRLWLIPRDHYKSTIVAIAYCIWLLIKNPEERILLAGDTAKNAEKKLSKIKSLILTAEGIRAFYPEIIPPNTRKTTWSDAEIIVPRNEAHAEPSIYAVGAATGVVGGHYTHIVPDDIIGKEAAESPTVMKSVVAWVDDLESLLVEPYTNTIDVVGTHKTHDDVYHHIKNHWATGRLIDGRPFFQSYVKDFWAAPGEALFPELYGGNENAREFAARMEKQNPYKWSCDYMNDPSSPEAEFDPDDLRAFTWDKDKQHVLWEEDGPRVASLGDLTCYMTVDPAYSKRKDASYAAITVSGCLETGQVFLLEALKGRWGSQGLVREIIKMMRRYERYLRAVGIEATGTQQSFVDEIRKEVRGAELYVPIHDLRPGSIQGKDQRIQYHLQRFVSTHRLHVHPEQTDFKREVKHFPLSKEKDLLDATAYAAEYYWQSVQRRPVSTPEPLVLTRDATTGY